MKVNTASWHYRFLEWADRKYFWSRTIIFVDDEPVLGYERRPVALCSYVDRLILALVAVPLILAWKALSEDAKTVVTLTVAGLFVGGVLFTVTFKFNHLIVALVIGQVVTWGIIGLVTFSEWWGKRHPRKPKQARMKTAKAKTKAKTDKIDKRKEPNLLWEWLRAKHRKICPYLEFSPRKSVGGK